MMNRFTIIGVVFLCTLACSVEAVSVSCMMAYEEGGAPAVFDSPECSQWFIFSQNSTRNCQFATVQGRRQYQEDRVTCNLHMKLPISAEDGAEEVTIGITAIFDGHGGDEASEIASRKFLDYFYIHAVFNAYNLELQSNKENQLAHIGKSSHRTLEEAILRTIQDIDTEFSKEALEKGYISGSTATVLLLVNDQFWIANLGDSKALLCSERTHPQRDDAEGRSLNEVYAEELTRDHHPDREDEKARIKAAGGFVSMKDIPRVNSVLAVSRSIGDVYLKRYGVVADPEITSWRSFTPENNYLVIASDGIFETLTPQDVCDLVHHKSVCETMSSSSVADCIVQAAFRTGSTDNLSAIVISDLKNIEQKR